MPPKKTFTKDDIIDAALHVTREQGLKNLSARTIAKKLNSSTMPIYSSVSSMRELEHEVAQRSRELFIEYSTTPRTGDMLLDSFLGYIRFAWEEKEFFRMMFFDDEDFSVDAYNEHRKIVIQRLVEHIKTDPQLAGLHEEQIRRIMEKLRIVAHGMASLISYGRLEEVQKISVEDFLKELSIYFIQCEKDNGAMIARQELS